MNKKYNLKLDLQFRCNNSIMKFNQFDNNTSDFFMRITNGGNLVDIEKALVVLAVIKPSGKVSSQFVEVKNGLVYVDLKPSMKDEIGTYTAKAMLILEDERVVTDVISYEVEEDKIFSLLNDTVETSEEFTLLTDMLSRLSTIEISEEQRMINEAERILSEENRKIEEAKRVEAELIRQHEEADRAKYDATRESNENTRKQNESIRLANETNRIDEESKRVEEEANRVEAEQLRKDNYNFMTEDEERRRSEANAHREAEVLRVQAENTRVNEEAKRRTTEQARILAENTRVSNENTRKANETARQTNETKRVEAETQRQNRYNSFIADAEANASNFENYTNTAKAKEEERKSNELDRKSQEDRRVSNEVERISNENTRKANEVAREKNETSRQNIFENKVNEVDKKIIEINTTKDNFVSSINTKVDTKISELNTTKDNFVSSVNTKVDSKISELDNTKSDMATSINNKVNEVENRFNALTSKQQQDAEVIDARDGETSLKARLDRDIEKAKQVYVDVEGSHISSDSSVGYAKDVEILGNTVQSASNLADIRSVGDKVEGQELYEIPVLSCGKNLWAYTFEDGTIDANTGAFANNNFGIRSTYIRINFDTFTISGLNNLARSFVAYYDKNKKYISRTSGEIRDNITVTEIPNNAYYFVLTLFAFSDETLKNNAKNTIKIQIEEGTVATTYEPYQEDKLTILSPTPLEKVGDVRDRIIEKDGVWGVEKNIKTVVFDGSEDYWRGISTDGGSAKNMTYVSGTPFPSDNMANRNGICDRLQLIQGNQFTFTGYNQIALHNSPTYSKHIYISTQCSSLEEFKQQLVNNPITLLYTSATSTFTPLPHDQQVKLRTFAGKTNISFLTEIEGTIKAQVPKSIGATVNTHTEQINNLNKELDRVKKLEESTVSTVTTESDFTTVEATSNGYFEDVKLEGKTLVNIHPKVTPTLSVSDGGNPKYNVTKKEGYIRVTGSDLEATSYRYVNMGRINFEMFKPNTTYTLVFTKFKGAPKITLQNGNSQHLIVKGGSIIAQDNKLLYTFVTTETLVKSEQILYLWIDPKSTTVDVEAENPMIFEGDLTANPPSGYIEGLKSVGQGLDEIVVESVNPNGNLFDGTLEVGSLNASGDTNWNSYVKTGLIRVKPSSEVICKIGKYKGETATSTDIRMAEYDMNKNFIKFKFSGETYSATVSDKTHYVKFAKKLEASDNSRVDISAVSDVIVVYGNELHDIPHQSDKKRLLYYNNETQTWGKPILREWDSIEKHADGKYYYHQRSGAKVLNGSENWNNDKNSSTMSPATYRQSIQFDAIDIPSASFDTKTSPNIISDLLPTVVFGDVYSYNHVGISISGTDSVGTHIIINNNFTDVTELKQWLQANNLTVVYQLAQEKVYECTNIDLITYANETNFIIESGVLSPKTTLKVHSNISNVVSLLQKKVSLLESNMTKYMITQNRLMLASRYNADTVSFKVDVASFSDTFEYDNDLYELILNNILVGKDNYNREYIENLIRFYWMDFVISDEMHSTLFEIIEEQHNPKVIEEETPLI